MYLTSLAIHTFYPTFSPLFTGRFTRFQWVEFKTSLVVRALRTVGK